MSSTQGLQYDCDLDFPIEKWKTYQTKFNARKSTHDKVLAAAEDAVKDGGTLTEKQKNEVEQVFLADLGDLAEYENADGSWFDRRRAIAYIRGGLRSDFGRWQERLGGQLIFTWESLPTGGGKASSSTLATSSNATKGRSDQDHFRESPPEDNFEAGSSRWSLPAGSFKGTKGDKT